MRRVGERIECEGGLYRVVKSSGETCSRCGCYPCRKNGKAYLSQCWKLIGNNAYLRYDKRAVGED